MAVFLRQLGTSFMILGGMVAGQGMVVVLPPYSGNVGGGLATSLGVKMVVVGMLIMMLGYLLITENYKAACLMLTAAAAGKAISDEFMRSVWWGLGPAGMMLVGLATGCKEGDADLWVWGLDL